MTAPIVFLDTETDGLHPGRRVWEVAMIRIPSRKGGRACAWKRTDKHVPEHLCRQEDAA